MQHNLAQLEYARTRAAEQAAVARRVAPSRRTGHRPGPRRRWAAAALARLAWRLDHDAALRVWP
jgi:hypothetical protein